ncbi:MAG: TraR/DksA C4-type zinc finger protein [Cytophagales bacterium]|nr:TraR/DksA C4-type zinc finger protein [Cytophagales bacterium]
MSPEQKEMLKVAIEKKIEESEQSVKDLREATKPMGLDSSIGRISRMDYINNKAVNEAELQKAENNLVALRRWLSIYDTEQFGKCTRCGQEININRLLLIPSSTRCINCAGK